MSSLRFDHLTPADVEAWLEGKLSLSASTHVGRCDDCRALLLAERDVVETLHQLPRFAPSLGFCDRVMAQVTLPTLAEVAASRPFRVGVWLTGAGLVTTLGVSIAWSLANKTVLTDASQWALGEGWASARAAADQLSTMLASTPVVRDVQRAIGTPARLAAVSGSLLVLYSTGLVALRRLLALPTVEAAHASR